MTPKKVVLYLSEAKGGVSMGTIASLMQVFASSSLISIMGMLSPFYLNPRDEKVYNLPMVPNKELLYLVYSCDSFFMGYDFLANSWTAPYVMQTIDTRIVHRSNALQGLAYGPKFIFYERTKAQGPVMAFLMSIFLAVVDFMLLNFVTRFLLSAILTNVLRMDSPTQEHLDQGYFKLELIGLGRDERTGNDQKVMACVIAERGDPGYR